MLVCHIQICDTILEVSPGDQDASLTKVVALIELSHFDEALALLDSTPETSTDRRFERAYCLYQLNRESEALAILSPIPKSEMLPKECQLAGQIK